MDQGTGGSGTAKALYAQIRATGYTGGYGQITAFVRRWRERAGQIPRAFVPLSFVIIDSRSSESFPILECARPTGLTLVAISFLNVMR